ncbi:MULTISPECIES: DUF4235 domain-containing protein [unclassified Rothia (in: high G+C Gram-positive bacteria)]|uniref:DUF4235 domain-containing protein n=1 Tax=unclassified Rothia (in: high G+C Gram-positive bacteria) TaxID=2689056 RepID=UPI00195AB4D0|nr:MULTISPECIES: DUF4235 domain-containing protein [unclassified Rothia (in: high G+C Gram-positive bacteria)]MBM7051514.1 DUF4235 domain-containing protein [Rothia sp. ZJ1223]QRZ61297.1 DUF4235 domain-containing protein [Rothia sp. ZJ932]
MSVLVKLGGTAASLGGVALSNKVLSATWKRITGNEPPESNSDPDERWRDIILWSLLTGLVGTIIKVSISRAQMKIEAKEGNKHGSQSEV